MGNHALWRVRHILILWCSIVGYCMAAGPTGEEESLADSFAHRYPAEISPDGHWLIFGDAGRCLHRVSLSSPRKEEVLDVGAQVRALSPSRSAKLIAVVTDAVKLFSFDPASPARGPWASTGSQANASTAACRVQQASDETGLSWAYSGASVALSADGTMLARVERTEYGEQRVIVSDIATGRTLHSVPSRCCVSPWLRFVDTGRKLLVVQPTFGEEYEGPSSGSAIDFGVWDLQSGELWNAVRIADPRGLRPENLQWSFSEASGALWFRASADNTRGNTLNAASPSNEPPRPQVVNLKACSDNVRVVSTWPLARHVGQEYDFAADPYGNWIATAVTAPDRSGTTATGGLVIRDARDGKPLTRWALKESIKSLTVSPDGKHIFGTTTGIDSGEMPGYYTASGTGGGQLKQFEVPASLVASPVAGAQPWPAKACHLDGENPEARQVVRQEPIKPHRLYALTIANELPESLRNMDRRCGGDWDIQDAYGFNSKPAYDGYEHPIRHWMLSDSGILWVDRGDKVDLLDPESGRVLRSYPTPRSVHTCSMPVFELREFLAWQGDTLVTRPFSEQPDTVSRTVVVRRPGWNVQSVTWLGDAIGVRWADKSAPAQGMDPAHNKAWAVVYDTSGTELSRKMGTMNDGYALFDDDAGGDFTGKDVFSSSRRYQRPGEFEWQRSLFGSIRAMAPGPAPAAVFWYGLHLDTSSEIREVVGLEGPIGLAIGPTDTLVFDASQHRILATLKIQGVDAAAWDQAHHVLLLQSRAEPGGKTILGAWRVE